MAKAVIPTLNICSLTNKPTAPNLFMASTFSAYLARHTNLHFPHKHSFYHLVYFAKGSGTHHIDFVNFTIAHGDIYFMVPGQVHTWSFSKQPDGFIINFSEEFINKLIANPRYLESFSFFTGIAAQQVINISKKIRPLITTLFEDILLEAQQDKPFAEDVIRTKMLQLFIQVQRQATPASTPADNYNNTVLYNFKKLIDDNYKTKKLTKHYAAMLYVTPNHLNALCKHATGRPAGEIIRERVLLEAKRLLVNANFSIAEIAAELDFSDNSYFGKFFKKYTGLTPETFRKQNI